MQREPRGLLSPGWIASHLFVLAAVVAMANLGWWQLRRLDERQEANAQVAAAMSAPPVDISVGAQGDGLLLRDYSAVVATGHYIATDEVLIGHRSYLGQAGYWLLTPLRTTDDQVVAVVRGWVPRRQVAGVDSRPSAPPPGVVEISGIAFASQAEGRQGETVAGARPELSRVDLALVEEVLGYPVAPRWIQLAQQQPPAVDLPVPVPPPELNDGPHLSYAFQWFFFSLGAVVVYWLILRRARRGRNRIADQTRNAAEAEAGALNSTVPGAGAEPE